VNDRLYESAMKHNSALDFDDLLLYGLQLFTEHPRVVENVKNVLIDEFQDTNDIQYQIVKRIAAASGALTIVGDPDQGIYAWRNADVENLAKMMKGTLC
jgi:DNA helicase-2/ATP-dependent DNA helicase PcrA